MADEYGTDIKRLELENIELRDTTERLQAKLDQLQANYRHSNNTKTDLSREILQVEEEKLKASKALVEIQIENNKLSEELEATKFELTNKILVLENELVELNMAKDKAFTKSKLNKERLSDAEKDRKQLADEYVQLKSNFAALAKEHDQEVEKNEELCVELLNLANAKNALMRQVANMDLLDNALAPVPGLAGTDPETDRVRKLVNRLSTRKMRPDQLLCAETERLNLEQAVFGNQQRFRNQMEKMKDHYEEQQNKMEDKIKQLMAEIENVRRLAHDRQTTVSQLNAQLITTRQERDEAVTQNNRLQHKLKDVNQEYRDRLVKYVADIAEFIDRGAGMPHDERTVKELQRQVGHMLQDIKYAHKSREEQLSNAAQMFKAQVQSTLRKYQEVLVAYRQLRQIVEEHDLQHKIAYPEETVLQLTDSELMSANHREIIRLREELNQAKLQADMHGPSVKALEYNRDIKNDLTGDLRRHVKEFTLNTQQDLENERARLMARNQMLEQQLKESQDYIDNHLARYKAEISRLRRIVGES